MRLGIVFWGILLYVVWSVVFREPPASGMSFHDCVAIGRATGATDFHDLVRLYGCGIK